MTDILKSVPVWFLIIAVLLLCSALTLFGGYFLWSIKGILAGFKDAVEELKSLITKLFDKHNDHETRLSLLEGRCDATHGPHSHPGGRRGYDPLERQETGG